MILKDNPEAVQIGLTATPRMFVGEKETGGGLRDGRVTAHNLEYFGEPVYEYSMGTGQEDGYLAACEVIRRVVDLDKKEITRQDIEQRSALILIPGERLIRRILKTSIRPMIMKSN